MNGINPVGPVDHQHKLADVGLLERHHIGIGVAQQLALECFVHHVVGRCLERQNGEMRGRQPLFQIIEAEACD